MTGIFSLFIIYPIDLYDILRFVVFDKSIANYKNMSYNNTCHFSCIVLDYIGIFMHTKTRHIAQVLEKRAKIFPALGVQGARQVGKSTFLIKQWQKSRKGVYRTFDKKNIALRANSGPEQFLLDESNNQKTHLIIDEAQKVPHIFDSIKALIDENRRISSFTLSGSVEFSIKSGVKESLAGRMGITQLYPLTLREVNNIKFISPWVDFNFNDIVPLKSRSVETWLERGGIPIFCQLSDKDERVGLVNSWVDALCYKDIMQLKDGRYNAELAYNLFHYLASDATLPLSQLAAEFGSTPATVKKHLAALCALFVAYKIPAFKSPRAQPKYMMFDAGVYHALRGGPQTIFSRHNALKCLVLNEIYAQYEYAGKSKPEIFYYQSRGGSTIDFILKTKESLAAIECTTSVDITPMRQRAMKSFLAEYDNAKGYFVAPVQEPYKIGKNIMVIPWNLIG